MTLQDLTGKEGNKLIERLTGEILDPNDYRTDYGSRGDRWQLVIRATRYLGATPVASDAGLDRGSVERAIRSRKPVMPHLRNRERIARAAARFATEKLTAEGSATPAGVYPVLQRFDT